jgi:hypothetical protein
MVVVSAGAQERRRISDPLRHLETKDSRVEPDRPLQVGDLEVHVADNGPGVTR